MTRNKPIRIAPDKLLAGIENVRAGAQRRMQSKLDDLESENARLRILLKDVWNIHNRPLVDQATLIDIRDRIAAELKE